MSVVAVCAAPGTAAATTTAVLLAAMAPSGLGVLMAECDPSGGDVGAWAQLPVEPGWSTAVSASQRSWTAITQHAQSLPSGLRVMTTSTRPSQARTAVAAAAAEFAPLLTAMHDVVTFADCGRVEMEAPAWAASAQLTVLLMRQASSAVATVARVDRTIETLDLLRAACLHVGVVLIGSSPYPAAEVEAALGLSILGVLPEDAPGAGLVCGGWTIGRGATKSPLARAAGPLSQRIVDAVERLAPDPAQVLS